MIVATRLRRDGAEQVDSGLQAVRQARRGGADQIGACRTQRGQAEAATRIDAEGVGPVAFELVPEASETNGRSGASSAWDAAVREFRR